MHRAFLLLTFALIISGCANIPDTLPVYWHDVSNDCKKPVPPMPQYAHLDVINNIAEADSGGKTILEIYARARRCLK